MDFRKFLPENVDYPHFASEEILPFGVQYQYVAHTFLNGFINYVEPIKAFVLGRYLPWDATEDEGDPFKVSVQDPPGSCTWITMTVNTKFDLYNLLIESGRVHHAKLTNEGFRDDVLILGKAKEENLTYWFFWYDCDTSDCCIGRFHEATQPERVIVEAFSRYVVELDCNKYGAKEIPLSYFQGWISG